MINMLADTYTDSSTNQCGSLAYISLLQLEHCHCTAVFNSNFNKILVPGIIGTTLYLPAPNEVQTNEIQSCIPLTDLDIMEIELE